MPRYLTFIAVAIVSLATASLAQAQDPIQTLDVAISPTKLDKKKPKSVQLVVDIRTRNNTAAATNSDQPPNASKTVVDFPKNIVIDTEAHPRCQGTVEQLENTTVEQAIEICGKQSIISVPAPGSFSHVTADSNPAAPGSTGIPIEVVLTAFNGPAENQLVFHNRADAVRNTTILNEELKKSTAGRVYGTQLITNIPPILAGAPDQFKVTIKKGTIVSAVCKSKTNPFKLTSTFLDFSPPVFSSTTETTCTQKKSKKKK